MRRYLTHLGLIISFGIIFLGLYYTLKFQSEVASNYFGTILLYKGDTCIVNGYSTFRGNWITNCGEIPIEDFENNLVKIIE